jgi:hypothetical protein
LSRKIVAGTVVLRPGVHRAFRSRVELGAEPIRSELQRRVDPDSSFLKLFSSVRPECLRDKNLIFHQISRIPCIFKNIEKTPKSETLEMGSW